jgi:integrase
MALKKQEFNDGEIAIFDDALIYKRGKYWQMRMWLSKEGKYARYSLRTTNQNTAIDKAKQHYHELMAQQYAGKTYFSKTTKQGVEEYLKQREKDVGLGLIVKGRYGTIKTHLDHWLSFIGRDTKLKELNITDGEDYYLFRSKTRKGMSISLTTVANEQSTINALMSWLYKRKETNIEAFEFKRMPRVDRGDEASRRGSFTDDEIVEIKNQLALYINNTLLDNENLSNVITAYYLLISIATGLRKGEQIQLRWKDIYWLEKDVEGQEDTSHSLVKITVRGETSKVRRTRHFVVKDWEYFHEYEKLSKFLYKINCKENALNISFDETLIFSADGITPISTRMILQGFERVLRLANIDSVVERNIVPYSFRHYFITDMVNKGVTPTQVAETCGTSTAQIEQTYYHTTEEKMIRNAMPHFDFRNGLLIPK